MQQRDADSTVSPRDGFEYAEEKQENPLTGDELDLEIGRTWRLWFDLYDKKLIEFLTAGSWPKTGELTMIVRKIRGEVTYCTAPTYEEVANMFVSELLEIRSKLSQKLSK